MKVENMQGTARTDRALCSPRRASATAAASMPTPGSLLAASAAAVAFGFVGFCSPNHAQTLRISDTESSVIAQETTRRAAAEDQAIRPFKVQIPQAALDDLRRRIAATRWPDKETDQSQGVPLDRLRELVRYWGHGYDWRKAEAKLNALPQFITNIDGVDIHFIHVRSRHKNALPLIVTHGWPGSVIEQLKIIGPLTDPTAHGGHAEDAFDLVIPSMPGYGFSGRPTGTGWGPDRIAQAWVDLMKRLGYTRYVAQGGDWGSPVSNSMARQAPKGLLGIHVNLPGTVPPEVAAVIPVGGPAPAGLSEKERAEFESLGGVRQDGEQGLRHDDDRTAAKHRLWRDGLSRWSRGVAARTSGLREMDVRRRSRAVADERRRAGQHHAVLADEHRRFLSAHLLGERRTRRHRRGRPEDR